MTVSSPATPQEARLVTVRGVVQGVGFRPFIARLARRLALVGWVRNESGAVSILIQGPATALDRFVTALRDEAPPLAAITGLDIASRPRTDLGSFEIVPSAAQPDRRQPISPDVAICAACEAELFDPADRRHRYPFITCTDCGPRFTVIEAMPYDRERTSMRRFAQCPACLAEYRDPRSRRFHSETNSCPACGPRLWLERPAETTIAASDEAIAAAAASLAEGRVLAVRGLGGFHLAVDATSEAAVRRLRARKHREAKPLAVMVRTVADARRIGAVPADAERLLRSRERPVVLLRWAADSGLAPSVAPGLDTVGVMTAYTPLHHLLLEAVQRPLVMTSGNLSEEPIATGNEDARRRLADVADAFLLHDREIVARYDDSVVRAAGPGPVFLRRARGYAPLPMPLPVPTPVPLVAVGPHLKNTFTLAHDGQAYVSQHIGDLENLETLEHFQEALATFRQLFDIEPRLVVHDRHPGYLSTRVAQDLGLPSIAVQHHVAHVAAVAGEHGVHEPVIGVAYDGTGYGDDGHVWGAEIFVADLLSARRVAHLRYAPLPGGDLAARMPWRAALGYGTLDRPAAHERFPLAFVGVGTAEREVAARQIERGVNAPLASSMGRLFDAAAAVLGVRAVARYEGQAPMELEALATDRRAAPLPFPLTETEDGLLVFEPLPLLSALEQHRRAGVATPDLAARFHASVAAATVEAIERIGHRTGVRIVALGGGVFQNARLLGDVHGRLRALGCRVLVPQTLSPNDGAISYGQAVIAAARLSQEGA